MNYSIVIPVYKSGPWMPELVERIGKTMQPYGEFELIFVNDCSPDTVTWPAIKECCARNTWVKGINLLINAGQFRATMCGLKYASGDYIITMDDDLQQPPEELPKLIHAMQEDKDTLCYIGKFDSKKHAWYRSIGTFLFQIVEKICYSKPLSLRTTSFRIMKSQLRDALLNCRTNQPQISPLLVSLTPKIKNVDVSHRNRTYGVSGYTLLKLISAMYSSIINSSTVPLRLFSLFGGLCLFGSFILFLIYFIKWLVSSHNFAGFTTTILLILVFGGFIVLGIGIIGEYLARIISQQTFPSLYTISELINISPKKD